MGDHYAERELQKGEGKREDEENVFIIKSRNL